MERIDQRWCGLDVHTNVVVACLMVVQAHGQKHTQRRPFRSVTNALLERRDGLNAAAGTPVAMASTGVSWRPRETL